MYSHLGEKSTAVTCPNGVLDVGQLEKAVRDGRCICRYSAGVSIAIASEEGGREGNRYTPSAFDPS